MLSSGSALIQLGVLGLLGLLVLVAAYSLPQKIAASILLVIIPFQPIDTQYFTANVALTYILFIAMLMRGENIRLPMLPQVLLLLFAYLVSMSQVHVTTAPHHTVYMIALISAILVFWIAYDLFLRFDDPRRFVQVLIAMNVLVLVYCIVQFLQGPGNKFILFGIEEIAMLPARKDNRLGGPFGGTGFIAEYFAFFVYILLYEIISSPRYRYKLALAVLAGVNLLFLVATGNRGGFLVLLGGGLLFLILFARDLGLKRVIAVVCGGSVLLVGASLIAINYTEFDRLFLRLQATEIEEGIPDTRLVVWPMAWERFLDNPVLGQGPRLELPGEDEGQQYIGRLYVRNPHNLYLFLLVTVGGLGLVAFLLFFLTPLFRCFRVIRAGPTHDKYLHGLAKVGALTMVIILVDQIKLDFMRFALVDYWHLVFGLLGFFVAVSERAKLSELEDSSDPGTLGIEDPKSLVYR